MVLEFWVMKVLLHPGPRRTKMTMRNIDATTAAAVTVHIAAGELTCLPDGCIAEPMECYASQLEAHAERERFASDEPDEDFRVVLNSSLVPA